MCQIISGSSAKVRSTLLNTPGLLADLFKSNADGLGAMYKNKRGLRVVKALPKNLVEVREFISNLPQDDRNLALHWRMRTHGKTDLLNCHPYDVVPGKVAMMHNGILATGNRKDPAKSDTWHFIQDFLADQVAACPEVVFTAGFQALVGDYIGGNRFVFMDDNGQMAIINRAQGIEYDGMWFANTYAWTPSLLIPTYPKPAPSRYSGYTGTTGTTGHNGYTGRGSAYDRRGGWDRGMDWYEDDDEVGSGFKAARWNGQMAQQFVEAVVYSDADHTAEILEDFAFDAITTLFARYTPSLTRHMAVASAGMAALNDSAARLVKIVLDGTPTQLVNEANSRASLVAETICYHIDWELKLVPDKAPSAPTQPASQVLFGGSASGADDYYEYGYLGYEVIVENDGQDGWGYTVYDADNMLTHGDTGFLSLTDAYEDALHVIDSITSENFVSLESD